MLLQTILVFMFVELSSAQNSSPCPYIFAYEPRGPEQDRWYGRLILTTTDELIGIWLRIQLDKPAELLGNWFGNTLTTDNKNYLIENTTYHFQPNLDPLSIRFFVKYNTERIIPSVTSLRLNGKIICPTGIIKDKTVSTQLYISHTKTTFEVTTERATDFEEFFTPPRHPRFSSDHCGLVKITARPQSDKQSADEGEWPWHAAIYRYKGIDMQYVCGGSLISTQHILTAAHCVTKSTGKAQNPEVFVVYLGKYNLYKSGPGVQSIQVRKVLVHPEYNATYFHNDIAILRLESPAMLTDSVGIVCLWDEEDSANNIIEKLGTVVTWSYNQKGDITENLMQAKIPVVSTESCIFMNRNLFSCFTSSKTYCAGFRNGTAACIGDSGGGMVFPKTNTRNQNVVWHLRGVISLSAALRNGKVEKVMCDSSNYIVFTDVAQHLDWIHSTIRR